MREYHTYLLDWDGNIFNSLAIWLKACRQGFLDCGVEIEDHDIALHIVAELITATNFGVKNLERFIEVVISSARDTIHLGEFHNGSLDFINHLVSKEKSYAVITSTQRQTINCVLNHYQYGDLFPHIVTREDVEKKKPHPEPILKGIELVKAKAETTVMIGDSPADIIAGRAARIDTILYYPPINEIFYKWEVLKETQPTYVIRHWNEVYEYEESSQNK